jgi:methyl-accepting chemotaxis protein
VAVASRKIGDGGSTADRTEYAASLIEGITEPFFMVNREFVVTEISDAACDLVGYRPDEVIGKMTCDKVFKSDVCETACAIKHVLDTGQSIEGVRVQIRDRSNNEIPIECSAGVLKNDDGEFLGGFEFMRDVTETVELEMKLNSASAELASAAQETGSAIQQMAATLQSVASQAGEVAGFANDVMEQLGESGEAVEDTVDGLTGIQTTTADMNSKMESLGAASDQIGEIVEVISGIADQTNLLALNAAIEAARAGEHGRGFAVVADEVRSLAERSANSTGEITGLIDEMQGSITSVLDAMEDVTGRVDDGVDQGMDTNTALNEVVGLVRQTLDQVTTMSASIEQVSAASQQVSASAQQVASLADTLSSMAADLGDDS